jgi:predicted transcriptional regulator
MEDELGVDKLFFELASESRLGILRELQRENLKMQEIARRLDVTATEAFRQLERLGAAKLVLRQPDSTFALTEYGKLTLQLCSALVFVDKHKEYFSTHDLMRLPTQFINRLGELSGAIFSADTVENLNICEHAMTVAEEYSWGIAEGTVPQHMAPIMEAQMHRGVKMRFLIPESRFQPFVRPQGARSVEGRSLPEIPVIMVLTEKIAGICFRQVGGRIDYAGFFGEDSTFHSWVRDLFVYYWDKGKRT